MGTRGGEKKGGYLVIMKEIVSHAQLPTPHIYSPQKSPERQKSSLEASSDASESHRNFIPQPTGMNHKPSPPMLYHETFCHYKPHWAFSPIWQKFPCIHLPRHKQATTQRGDPSRTEAGRDGWLVLPAFSPRMQREPRQRVWRR